MKKSFFTLLLCFGLMMSYGQALKVAANGNVGVNQSNPTQRIHLSDAPANSPGFLVEATGSNFIKAAAGTTASAFFYQDNRFFTIVPGANTGTVGANQLNSFAVVGATANVGIGTWSPTEKLDVVGNIKASGTITPSDLRLKSDVQDLGYGLKEVLELNPVRFKYNGKGGTIANSKHIGLIAQEVQEVIPDIVKEFQHKPYKTGSIGDDLSARDSEQYLEIKDSEIKYLLINAIKDQQEIIKEQNERISALEEALSNLNNHEISIGSVEIKGEQFSREESALSQNRPNPFTSSTVIDYNIPGSANNAEISIFDINGQMIKTVVLDHTGKGSLKVNTNDLQAGAYSYQLVVDGQRIDTKKMIIQR